MRKLFFLLFLLTFLEACVPTYIDRIKVKTTSNAEATSNITHINNLLILAKGTNATRVVSSNLYSAIEKLMSSNGSRSEFEFRNTFRNAQQIDIASVPDNFDGYLLISSRDSSSIKMNQSKYVFAAPASATSTISGTGYGSAYEDVFLIKLYNSDKKLVYTGEINFHFNPANDDLYKFVAKKLVKQLSLSNILLW